MTASGHRHTRTHRAAARAASSKALTQPSERVQAKYFAETLGRDLAAMSEKLAKAEIEWQRRCESEGLVDPPARLLVVRERVGELDRMLKALRTRFRRVTDLP
jgi:hypothetical protein